MADYRAPLDDIRFVLYDVMKCESLWQSLPEMVDLDRPTADAILQEAAKICEQVIAPLNRDADEQGCRWHDHEVSTPDGFKEAYTTFCEGGWGGLAGSPEMGGMGMPKSLISAFEEMLQGACMSFGLAPMLTSGACLAIDAHGSDALKQLYLPKMYSGEWSGAMDLTEPQAGSDLGLIRTKAEPEADGSYRLTGTKIFITWGEHDMVENIVHLVLAKLPGAPAGSKGISMFLVPKWLPNPDGSCGARNQVHCGSLEKKMGIKASATCVMNYEGAQGWLIGEPNQGLACMFTMMNYERLVVGIQAIGAAEVSYQNALAYARERLQGRGPDAIQEKAPKKAEQKPAPLLAHPDVRRMLLTMKAYNEGSRAFYIYVAQWLDIAKFGLDPELRRRAQDRVSLFTPVAKAFISDMAFDVAVLGQQVFGGHGYVRDWGQEQLVRDIRITQIYEGTNGIQAADLIGRKTVACGGALVKGFISEVEAFMVDQQAVLEHLELDGPLQDAVEQLRDVTEDVVVQGQRDASAQGSVAVSYSHLLGHVTYGFLWARMACVAHRSAPSGGPALTPAMDAKIKTAQYYFKHLLPRIDSLSASIRHGSDGIMSLSDEQF